MDFGYRILIIFCVIILVSVVLLFIIPGSRLMKIIGLWFNLVGSILLVTATSYLRIKDGRLEFSQQRGQWTEPLVKVGLALLVLGFLLQIMDGLIG